jgi:hypothetical protein
MLKRVLPIYFLLIFIAEYRAQHPIQHILGGNIGTQPCKNCEIYHGGLYKFETNANYTFRYRLFAANLTTGVAPVTKYGAIWKSYFSIGILTNPDRLFSYYLNFGGGFHGATKAEYADQQGAWIYVIQPSERFSMGFYLNTFKNRNLLLGLEASLTQLTLSPKYSGSGPSVWSPKDVYIIPMNVNLSINYIFKSKKRVD